MDIVVNCFRNQKSSYHEGSGVFVLYWWTAEVYSTCRAWCIHASWSK